jgi:hypothetical protein
MWLTGGWISSSEKVVDQIDHVTDVNDSVTITVSRLCGAGRITIPIQIVGEVDHVCEIDHPVGISITQDVGAGRQRKAIGHVVSGEVGSRLVHLEGQVL